MESEAFVLFNCYVSVLLCELRSFIRPVLMLQNILDGADNRKMVSRFIRQLKDHDLEITYERILQ